ncbi:MAG: methyltransferase, partial [Acidobacteriota bacterium]
VDFAAAGAIRSGAEPPRRPEFLFASRPERGLETLLRDLWPRILNRLPDAGLRVTSYAVPTDLPPAARAAHRRCRDLVRRTPGVHGIGPLRRREFWRHLASSSALLYPTDFPETNCMVALEAQALGVPLVTSDRFALAETVGFGPCRISAPWGSSAYGDAFVDLAVRLVEDPPFRAEAVAAGDAHVSPETHSWDRLAETWEHEFGTRFQGRFRRRRAGILRRLLRDSQAVAARRLVDQGAGDGTFDPLDLQELERRETSLRRAFDAPGTLFEPPPGSEPVQMTELWKRIEGRLAGVQNATLLDVGCGEGNLLLPLLRRHPGWTLTGIDGNRGRLDLAAERARRLGLGDRVRLLHAVDPHVDGGPEIPAHDVAVLAEVLEFFDDPAALLAWAEARARRGVVGYVLDGPWEILSGETWQRHQFDDGATGRLLAHVEPDLDLHYVPCGQTPRGEILGCRFFSYRPAGDRRPGALDLDRLMRRAPPLPKVTATLMVKDEEANVRRCVDSLAPFVDQIWVADTGSRDATAPILKSIGFGTEQERGRRILVPMPFEDFSRTRNTLANRALGDGTSETDYLLWQDADEILHRGEVLRRLVDANVFYDAFAIEQRHVTADGSIRPDHPLRCYRPRGVDGRPRFFGCIHEQVQLGLNEPVRRMLICPETHVVHLGYLGEAGRLDKSFGRNLPLFLKDRREHPDRWVGHVLGVREFLLIARQEIRHAGRVTPKAYRHLNWSWELWRRSVRPLPAPFYRRLGFDLSRAALEALGRHRLPLRATGQVPFAVDFGLEIGPSPSDGPPRPRAWTWVADADELREIVEERFEDALSQTTAAPPRLPPEETPTLPSRWSEVDLPPELFDLEPFAEELP